MCYGGNIIAGDIDAKFIDSRRSSACRTTDTEGNVSYVVIVPPPPGFLRPPVKIPSWVPIQGLSPVTGYGIRVNVSYQFFASRNAWTRFADGLLTLGTANGRIELGGPELFRSLNKTAIIAWGDYNLTTVKRIRRFTLAAEELGAKGVVGPLEVQFRGLRYIQSLGTGGTGATGGIGIWRISGRNENGNPFSVGLRVDAAAFAKPPGDDTIGYNGWAWVGLWGTTAGDVKSVGGIRR